MQNPVATNRQEKAKLLIDRPEGYFSRDRDLVQVAGKLAADEPTGLPILDSFVVNLPSTNLKTVTLRAEAIAARPSAVFAHDLPIAEFLW
jgi:hypothetical protein